MQIGFTLADGREIPVTVRTGEEDRALRPPAIDPALRLATAAGVLPLGAWPAPRDAASTDHLHHNGRREVSVFYRLGDERPATGPARRALDEQIRRGLRTSTGRRATRWAPGEDRPRAGSGKS